jgi:YfiH family protein
MAAVASLARGSFGEVNWLVTSRLAGDFASTIGTNGFDSNRKNLKNQIGRRVVFPVACHGDSIAQVDASSGENIEQVDGLMTQNPDIALATLSADCATVLIYAQDTQTICALHAGWRGMKNQILIKALTQMQHQGENNFKVVIGPAICAQCYQVDEERYLEVKNTQPEAAVITDKGFAIDIQKGLISQLAGFKIDLQVISMCTFESNECFSFRRDNDSQRMASVIWFNS